MNPRLSLDPLRVWYKVLSVVLLSFMLTATVLADVEEDFNSPTPILLSERGSTRALAIKADDWNGTIPRSGDPQAFTPGEKSRVMFFVTDLSLMDGEGANAFRIYLEDPAGRSFRFEVQDIQPVTRDNAVYAVIVSLYDPTEYYGQPQPVGDHLVRLTWRGLASNRVRMGIGKLGGEIQDDKGAVPTSYPLSKKAREQAEASVAPEYVGLKFKGDRTRFMEQAAFGPSPALNERLRRIGIKTWIAEQLDAAAPSTPYPFLPLMPSDSGTGCSGSTNPNCNRDNYQMYPMQVWFYTEALYGENQLLHRTSWALNQIWVTANPEVQQPSHMLQYQKLLDKHAFGNYRNLMQDMTLNPAMGIYLDMLGSTRNNPNENYAREVLQLFTIGLFMLNPDGTAQVDGNNVPVPTYSQDTVNNFTEIFTGWQLCQQNPPTCPSFNGNPNYTDSMLLNQNLHNVTTKTLLAYPGAQNVDIPANQNGAVDLNAALNNIFNHPNVGPFVSKKMIQHLVTSDPTPAYVGRVAAIFNNDGFGNRGNMKAVVKAILLDPEARGDIKTDPNYGKLREPVQAITNVLRNFNVRNVAATGPSDCNINPRSSTLGQSVYQAPSVFNYFPADYIVPGTTVVGPEFGILNTGSSIARANLMNTLVFNTIPVSNPDTPAGTSIDLTGLQALSAADSTGNLLLDELNNKMMHGTMSSQMRSSILTATTVVASTDTLTRSRQALYLVATSSQFQVQR
ncbi:MAG TPA: DUF1800 domain-containing protein [Pyrinomonadaceae bacterium]|jgi:uncharacterized protein (DUF1800 family)|nr:DUF1800 domain-containing protein [Pyrinomonadaceae bacterium]